MKITQDTSVNRAIIENILSPFIDKLLPPTGPQVGDHNKEYVNTWTEVWDFVNGFKDGIVGVTGKESKSYLCNANITNTEAVFYKNIAEMFDGTHFVEDDTIYDASMLELMGYIQDALQWPYFTLYSCYWAGVELYTPA